MIKTITIDQIDEGLKKLPPEKLAVVYDFVSYLTERTITYRMSDTPSEAYETMLASEAVLARDWNLVEEDLAWADL